MTEENLDRVLEELCRENGLRGIVAVFYKGDQQILIARASGQEMLAAGRVILKQIGVEVLAMENSNN